MVEIPRGASARRVVGLLSDRGVVDNPWVFEAYLRLMGRDTTLRHGRLLLSARLTPHEVARRLTRGTLVPVRVVVPEGWNRFEIARRMAQLEVCPRDAFLAASEGHEGYLFPDSYDFEQRTEAAEVVGRMRANWEEKVGRLLQDHAGEVRARDALDFDPRDVLVLASVVEEEAAVGAERATIAGVFLNRLRSDEFRPRHRLQADPTVSYGCISEPEQAPSCADFAGEITQAMLRDSANRYNTYRHGGLPPGPISNPGRDSILAVIQPEAHDYFYFVARGGGRHAFSASLGAHNEAVQDYRRAQRPTER